MAEGRPLFSDRDSYFVTGKTDMNRYPCESKVFEIQEQVHDIFGERVLLVIINCRST